jgi:hypothetical protein
VFAFYKNQLHKYLSAGLRKRKKKKKKERKRREEREKEGERESAGGKRVRKKIRFFY